jgi:hypothetical protein
VKLHGYSYRIHDGDSVMPELDINKTALQLFVNNVIRQLDIANVSLPCCFLIVSVGKIDEIEFQSLLLHVFNPTYKVKFLDKTKHVKWLYRNY